MTAENLSDREIIITRTFDAPRELVWQAMTDPQHVVHWWGPRGFSTTIEKMDFRVGGVWKHLMRGPDGAKCPNESVFQEIIPLERIVYAHGGRLETGSRVHFIATWTFETVESNKTKLTLHSVFPSAADRDFVVKNFGAIEGGKQTLERLSEHLPQMLASTPPFVITRTFAAPRTLVWKVWTEREHLLEWFGPSGSKLKAATLDFRPGGIFHYCLQGPDGNEMWGKFVYREIVTPEKIVLVNSFSDAAGGLTRHPASTTWPLEMLSTTTFAEQDGKTLLTFTWTPWNATATEWQTFNSARPGMNQGWTGTFEQLTAYLSKITNH